MRWNCGAGGDAAGQASWASCFKPARPGDRRGGCAGPYEASGRRRHGSGHPPELSGAGSLELWAGLAGQFSQLGGRLGGAPAAGAVPPLIQQQPSWGSRSGHRPGHQIRAAKRCPPRHGLPAAPDPPSAAAGGAGPDAGGRWDHQGRTASCGHGAAPKARSGWLDSSGARARARPLAVMVAIQRPEQGALQAGRPAGFAGELPGAAGLGIEHQLDRRKREAWGGSSGTTTATAGHQPDPLFRPARPWPGWVSSRVAKQNRRPPAAASGASPRPRPSRLASSKSGSRGCGRLRRWKTRRERQAGEGRRQGTQLGEAASTGRPEQLQRPPAAAAPA